MAERPKQKPSGGFVETHSRSLASVPARWRQTAQRVFESACAYDGLPTESSSVSFSALNPFVPFYERAMRHLWEEMSQAQAFGYVGQTMEHGRAQSE